MLCIICYLNSSVLTILEPEKYCPSVSQNTEIVIVDIHALGV